MFWKWMVFHKRSLALLTTIIWVKICFRPTWSQKWLSPEVFFPYFDNDLFSFNKQLTNFVFWILEHIKRTAISSNMIKNSILAYIILCPLKYLHHTIFRLGESPKVFFHYFDYVFFFFWQRTFMFWLLEVLIYTKESKIHKFDKIPILAPSIIDSQILKKIHKKK